MSRQLLGLRAASAVAGVVPTALSRRAAASVGGLDALIRPGRYQQLASNLARVSPEARIRPAVASYGRYWAESFACPEVSTVELDRSFSFAGYDHILSVQSRGVGPVLALPHLGGWEWAAAWLARVAGNPVTAVAEHLEDDVFEWFRNQREGYGVEVIGHDDPATMAKLLERIRQRRVLTLLADRDLEGGGVAVTLFGEQTTIPGGPALLSLRSGAPILPTAVFFRHSDRLCIVGAPIWPERHGRLRDDVARLSQAVASAFEPLIAAAPHQWHVLGPLWLADRDST